MREQDVINLEGRLNDGNAYALKIEGAEGTVRVCDASGPEALWARISLAKKAGGDVTFSGARAEPNGKIDGFAIIPAAKIEALFNYGPSLLGITEARLARLEDAMAEHAERINEIEGDLAEDEGGEEGEAGGEGATITPLPTEAPVPPEAAAALAAAARGDEEDEG